MSQLSESPLLRLLYHELLKMLLLCRKRSVKTLTTMTTREMRATTIPAVATRVRVEAMRVMAARAAQHRLQPLVSMLAMWSRSFGFVCDGAIDYHRFQGLRTRSVGGCGSNCTRNFEGCGSNCSCTRSSAYARTSRCVFAAHDITREGFGFACACWHQAGPRFQHPIATHTCAYRRPEAASRGYSGSKIHSRELRRNP